MQLVDFLPFVFVIVTSIYRKIKSTVINTFKWKFVLIKCCLIQPHYMSARRPACLCVCVCVECTRTKRRLRSYIQKSYALSLSLSFSRLLCLCLCSAISLKVLNSINIIVVDQRRRLSLHFDQFY